MMVVAADETTWPTRAGIVEWKGTEYLERTGWGALHRIVDDAFFFEAVETVLPHRIDPD